MTLLHLWWRQLLSHYRLIDNYCKRCGQWCETYDAPNDLYYLVTDGREYCIHCFDQMARAQGIYLKWMIVRK